MGVSAGAGPQETRPRCTPIRRAVVHHGRKALPMGIPFMEASDPVLLAGGEENIGSRILLKKYYSHKGKNVL